MSFLRQSWKQKPRQFGPLSFVQSSLFENCQRLGLPVPPMAFPLWEKAGQKSINYGKLGSLLTSKVSTDTAIIYGNEGISFPDPGQLYYFNSGVQPQPDYTNLSFITGVKLIDGIGTGSSYQNVGGRRRLAGGFFYGIHVRIVGPWRLYTHYDGVSTYTDVTYDKLYDATQFAQIIDGTNCKRILDDETLSSYVISGTQTYTTGHTSGADAFNLGSNYGSNDFDTGYINYVLLFSEAITESKIAEIRQTPWQLWQPRTVTDYFFPSAGGGSTILPIYLDGKIKIKSTTSNLLDGLLAVKNEATNLLDGKATIQTTSTDLLNGKTVIKSTDINLLDGKAIIKDVTTSIFDGKVSVGSITENLLDGKAIIKDSTTDNLDGKVIIEAGGWSTDNLDGKVTIKSIATDYLDGLIIIGSNTTNTLDGKIILNSSATANLDGKVTIKDVATGLLDGQIVIKTDAVNILDGKLIISQVAIGLLDGKAIIKDSSTILLDGKIILQSDSATDIFDGKIIISVAINGKVTITFAEIKTPTIGFSISTPEITMTLN